MKDSGKKIARHARRIFIFVMLSIIGSMIKLNGDLMNFEPFAGYFSALILSPAHGSAVAFFGHLAANMYTGHLTLINIFTAIAMGVGAYGFGYIIKKKNIEIAILGGSILSGILIALSYLPVVNTKDIPSLMMSFTLISFLNILLVYFMDKALNHPHKKGVLANWINRFNEQDKK